MAEISDELQTQVREYLETQVRSGFADLGTLANDTGEIFADDANAGDIEAFAGPALQDILIDYRAEQRRWPTVTDCDRLDAAFAELEAGGIVARQNFWCCGTCGLAAIGDEMETAGRGGIDIRGYTFYHEQDTESAVEGRGVCLYYGATTGIEEESLAVATEIQATLEQHGLSIQWNGTFEKRIHVAMDWKRR